MLHLQSLQFAARSAANEWLSGSVPLGEIHPNSLKRPQLFFHGVYRCFAQRRESSSLLHQWPFT